MLFGHAHILQFYCCNGENIVVSLLCIRKPGSLEKGFLRFRGKIPELDLKFCHYALTPVNHFSWDFGVLWAWNDEADGAVCHNDLAATTRPGDMLLS